MDADAPGDRDAGMPRWREPEPDLGPDARPSDYPDADDWEDPPDLGEDDPCCVLGEPVRVTSRAAGMSLLHYPPLIAWGPGSWGIAVARYLARTERTEGETRRVVLFELAPAGEPLGEAEVLDLPPLGEETIPQPEALRWAAGRWALAISGDPTIANERVMLARLFDADLTPASEWLPIGVGLGGAADLAYLSHGDQWQGLVATFETMSVTRFDELAGVEPAVPHPADRPTSLRAASFRSRVATLLGQYDDRLGAPNEIVVLDSAGGLLGHVRLGVPRSDASSLTALRDLAVAVMVEGGRVQVQVVDPFALTSAAGPRAIGEAWADGEASGTHGIDVAGSNKFGVAGVCWGVPGGGERGEDSQILFRLVGPDAHPRGAAVQIVESAFRGSIVNCSVGSDGAGFLVGWWDGSELWVRRVDVAPER